MKKYVILIAVISLIWSFTANGNAYQNNEESSTSSDQDVVLEMENINIHGSLRVPDGDGKHPVVLIIAGSGPTDRNANNMMGLKTNAYKMISDTLAAHGIASLRYDKRGIAESTYEGFSESDLTFDDYVNDAAEWLKMLKAEERFDEVFILGHSEGSLIGTIVASKYDIAGLISAAGTAQKADSILLEQLSKQGVSYLDKAKEIFDSLNAGKTVDIQDPNLQMIFRNSVQPYMISWIKYDPVAVMSEVDCPVLVIHGEKDIQINYKEAQKLADTNPEAEAVVLEEMDHVLKNLSGVYMETYSNPELPLSPEFSEEIVSFIKSNSK